MKFTWEENQKGNNWEEAKVLWLIAGPTLLAILIGMTGAGVRKPNYGELIVFILLLGFIYYLNHRIWRNHRNQAGVIIDYDKGVVCFYNLTFWTNFVGNEALPIAEIEFSGILKSSSSRRKGSYRLEVMTTKGATSIIDVGDLSTLSNAFNEIIGENKRIDPEFESRLKLVPRPKTAPYGWAVLIFSAAILLSIIWHVIGL